MPTNQNCPETLANRLRQVADELDAATKTKKSPKGNRQAIIAGLRTPEDIADDEREVGRAIAAQMRVPGDWARRLAAYRARKQQEQEDQSSAAGALVLTPKRE